MKKRILIILDDASIRQSLDKKLRADGYSCYFALSGEMGFKTAIETKPDVILLDVILPDTSGFDLCRRLRRAHKTEKVPIIMLTTEESSDQEVIGFGKTQGFLSTENHLQSMCF